MTQGNDSNPEAPVFSSMRRAVGAGNDAGAQRRLKLDASQMDVSAPAEILVLAPSQRLNQDTSEAQAAFSELDMSELGPSAANSTRQPPLTREKFTQMAQSTLKQQIDALGTEMVQDLVDRIVPEKVDMSFAKFTSHQVEEAVARIAPQKIMDIADQLMPLKLEQSVREIALSEVHTYLPKAMDLKLKATVANLIRKELAGDLGRSVTDKVRILIQNEISRYMVK